MQQQETIRIMDHGFDRIAAATNADGPLAGILELWLVLVPDYAERASIDPRSYLLTRGDYDRAHRIIDNLGYSHCLGTDRGTYSAALSMELANIGPSTAD